MAGCAEESDPALVVGAAPVRIPGHRSRVADGVLAAQRFDAQASSGSATGTQSNTIKAFESTAQLGTGKNSG